MKLEEVLLTWIKVDVLSFIAISSKITKIGRSDLWQIRIVLTHIQPAAIRMCANFIKIGLEAQRRLLKLQTSGQN